MLRQLKKITFTHSRALSVERFNFQGDTGIRHHFPCSNVHKMSFRPITICILLTFTPMLNNKIPTYPGQKDHPCSTQVGTHPLYPPTPGAHTCTNQHMHAHHHQTMVWNTWETWALTSCVISPPQAAGPKPPQIRLYRVLNICIA